MTRDITYDDEEFAFSVNTFWGGTDKGESVQVTLGYNTSYVQMTREEALHLFRTVVTRLETQVKMDKHYPPWWQEIDAKAKKRKALSEAKTAFLEEFDNEFGDDYETFIGGNA